MFRGIEVNKLSAMNLEQLTQVSKEVAYSRLSARAPSILSLGEIARRKFVNRQGRSGIESEHDNSARLVGCVGQLILGAHWNCTKCSMRRNGPSDSTSQVPDGGQRVNHGVIRRVRVASTTHLAPVPMTTASKVSRSGPNPATGRSCPDADGEFRGCGAHRKQPVALRSLVSSARVERGLLGVDHIRA